MLAQPLRRPSSLYNHPYHQYQTSSEPLDARISTHGWLSSSQVQAQAQAQAPSEYSHASYDSHYLPAAIVDQSAFVDCDAPHNFNNLHIHVDSSFESSQEPELMHSEHTVAPVSWNFMHGQLTPTSGRTHYRESSLSSIGSAGPPSPYNGSTPHPHVILPSDSDTQYDGMPLLDQTAYHTFSKPLTPSHTPSQDAFLVPPFPQSYNAQPYHANAHIAALLAMQRQHQAPSDDESVSAPEYSHPARPSVANNHDSPVSPTVAGEYEDTTRKNDLRNAPAIPKLGRTMSDAYNDELYSPSFTFTSAPSTEVERMNVPNPSSAVFSQMLQAANDQHLSAPLRSPMIDQSRDQKIAFREGSPLAPVSNGFGSPQRRYGSAQQIRERQKAERDDRIVQQQLHRVSPVHTAPTTISPRDALLDFHENAEDSAMPLFPNPTSPQYHLSTGGAHAPAPSDLEETSSQQSYGSMATTRRQSSSAYSTSSQITQQPRSNFTFVAPSASSGVRIPRQYPFVPQRRSQSGNISSLPDRSPEFLSTSAPMESSNSNGRTSVESNDLKKPIGSNADGGTYTCTYHGCTLRFETPAKLQKHKREGHRLTAPLAGGIPASTQAGPHRCFRVNPSTNKVCNTVFSRPYDLTRHEDTIHNASKIKVRCHLCKEEKTFSRNDALTRHMRLVHPHEIITVPTKRKGDGNR